MNYAHAMQEINLNPTISEFGKKIFTEIGKEQPSTFNKNYWSGKIMEWSMTKPEFKVNMFRLVDVLPTLKNSEAIARHVNEYLGKVGSEMNGLMDWGLNVDPRSIRAKLTAMAVRKSVEQMASQFIAGETPQEALKPLQKMRKQKIAFTADLLGEFCVSEEEAESYMNRYLEALDVFGKEMHRWKEAEPIIQGHPGESTPICISVKMTALYSQCSVLNLKRSVDVLAERLKTIALKAQKVKALMYIDAEDSASNIMIYRAFKQVFSSPELKDFPFPGIVLQAYARDCATHVKDFIEYAKKRGAPIAIRLVKGAYWDHETVMANQYNLASPLFSKKESSDANYEYLSRTLIDNHNHVLPAFGSHNVRSLAHACCYAESRGLSKKDFELQMLFGMADPIARAFTNYGYLVRQYVPLGQMLPGIGYLVRRLLENTSNESFLRHTFYDADELERLLAEPQFRD